MNQQNKKFKVLGIMSGTSFDGIDFCHATFEENKNQWNFEITKAHTYSYSEEWIQKILSIEKAHGADLIQLHYEYGHYLGELSKTFIQEYKLDVDFIASHGHTIFHQINKGFTFQLGHGATIASASGIKTVSDFRSLDVALGGEGAPLVPIGDHLLFQQYSCCINLGGIANLSFLKNNKRIAFDVAPANMVLNYLYRKKFKKEFDLDGEVSQSGTLDPDLLLQLNQISFYQKEPPKSLGKEWVFEHVIPVLDRFPSSTENKLHTFSVHLAHQLNKILEQESKKGNVLVTGGGAKNKFLMNLIKSHNICVNEVSEEIIDFKEALIFAFLGTLRILGRDNTIKEVTGASKNSCGGTVFLP